MNTYANKTVAKQSWSVANAIVQKRGGNASAFQFADNRPATIVQTKRQNILSNSSWVAQMSNFDGMANNRASLTPAAQLKNRNNYTDGATIQMANRLTMHAAPLDTRLAGGGIGSDVDTGQEVQAVIDSGVLQDMKDSRAALRQSIQVRRGALNPDAGHAARITQEEGWLAQLDTAIRPLEEARLRSWQEILRGPKPPPPPPGPAWKPPPGPVWGKGK